jgi:hypothetical protein
MTTSPISFVASGSKTGWLRSRSKLSAYPSRFYRGYLQDLASNDSHRELSTLSGQLAFPQPSDPNPMPSISFH